MTRAPQRPLTPMPPSRLVALSGWVALAATRLPASSLIRVLPVTLFILLGPGTAFARRWLIADLLEKTVIAVALSTAIATLTSEALVLGGMWSSTLALALLATATTVAEVGGSRLAAGRLPKLRRQ